ncbi:MAG: insulinase family protein, partial [Gemmatimonadales bacterium]
RLFELSQGENPPFLGAGGGRGGFVRTKDVVSFSAGVQSGGALRGFEALVIEAERARRFGFAPSEIERQRARMVRSAEQAMEERDRTASASHAGAWVANFLSASPVLGAEQRLTLQRQLLPAIDSAVVHQMVTEWFSRGSLVVSVNGPAREDAGVPTAGQLLDVLRRVAGTPLTPYVDAEVSSELVADQPTPGRIVSERTHEGIDVVEWHLSNGATVFLKSTDFQADQIMFQAWSPGGYSLVEDAAVVSAREASAIVSGSGLGEHSAPDLRRLLAGKVAQMQGIVLEEREGLIGGASGRDLETMFQMAYLHFTAPRSDATAFQAHRGRMEAALANRSASPEAAFGDTLSVIMAQHHARRSPFTPDMVQALDLDQAARFYRERFNNAGDFTFFLVGSFNADSVRALVELWIGGLPSSAGREQPRDLGIRPPDGVTERVVRRGVEPRARTQIVFTGNFSQSRENRHILRSLGEALQIRLREVIREDLGGTYGV